MADLDVSGIIRTLEANGVRYVVIGGIAALSHDLPLPATVDVDVTPARDEENLLRLAAAFDELDAGLLTAEEAGTWFPRPDRELVLLRHAAPDDEVRSARHRLLTGRRPSRL